MGQWALVLPAVLDEDGTTAMEGGGRPDKTRTEACEDARNHPAGDTVRGEDWENDIDQLSILLLCSCVLLEKPGPVARQPVFSCMAPQELTRACIDGEAVSLFGSGK